MQRHVPPLRHNLASLCVQNKAACPLLCPAFRCSVHQGSVLTAAVTGNTVGLEGPGCERCQLHLPWGFTCNRGILGLSSDNVFWHLQIWREGELGKIGSTSTSYSDLRWKQTLMDQNFLMEETFQFLIKSVFYNVLKQKNFILQIKLRHNVWPYNVPRTNESIFVYFWLGFM